MECWFLLLLCVHCLATVPIVIKASCDTAEYSEKELVEAVFGDPETMQLVRPVKLASTSVKVGVYLYIRGIVEVIESSGLVRMSAFLFIEWPDELHVWKDRWPYNCTSNVVLPIGEHSGIWKPDLVMPKSSDMTTIKDTDLVRIFSDGMTSITPGCTIEFRCLFDVSLFPFDEQKCSFTVEMWKSMMVSQYIHEGKAVLDYDFGPFQNDQWSILGIGTYISNISYFNGAFSYIEIRVNLKRKATFYLLTILLPTLALAGIVLMSFTLPINDPSRVEVAVTCMLAYSVFMSMMATDLPHSSDNPPLMLISIDLFTLYIVMVAFSQSLCMHFNKKAEDSQPVPPRLSKALRGLACCLCFSKKAIYECESEWNFVANVVDKFSMVIYFSLVTSTTFVSIVLIPALSGVWSKAEIL